MSTLRKIPWGILLAVLLANPVTATAAAIPSRHSTSSRSDKANKRPKTVHVKSYKKKNGTVVKAHERAAPQPK